MSFQCIDDLSVRGQRVFVRVDFNVPFAADGTIRDDARIQAALPTVRELAARGARVVLASHLGRPKGQVVESLRMAPVARRLGELLGQAVWVAADLVGPATEQQVAELEDGQVGMLENLRFHAGETANDSGLARDLARLADLYVNDAFGTAHRAHASTVGVPSCLPATSRAAGRLMEKELAAFDKLLTAPERPFVGLLGGAKVSDKILVVEEFVERVDALLIGGGMAYTFLLAQGHAIGSSLVEKGQLEVAAAALRKAEERGVRFLLPCDHVVATEFSESAAPQVVEGVEIPDGCMALDLGPKSRAAFTEVLREARTVLWNGPLGVFEWDAYAAGTREIAEAIAASDSTSVVGGGDSLAVIKKYDLYSGFTHISTGGGASLEILEGKQLPGVEMLQQP